jgi:uncharacterized phiE125 gp8 family phage protein
MLRTITAPASDPVSLDEAKRHLLVDWSDDDELIAALISAATLQAQVLCQRLFVTQTVELILDGWPCGGIRLPVAPVQASDGIISIKYHDQNDVLQTWDPSQYVVRQDGQTVCIFPKWSVIWPILSVTPAAEPVVVRFTAGQAALDVPANVKAAIKLLVGHLYANREAVVIAVGRVATAIVAPLGVEELLRSEVWS